MQRPKYTLDCESLEGRALMTAARPFLPAPVAEVAPARTALASRDAALEDAVRRVMAEYHLPGVVAGVYTPGRPAWKTAQGVADESTGRAMTLDDRFPIRSVTKSYTATLILMLAREGKVSLRDPIAKYVDGIPNGDRITLANLAGMTSGVKDYTQTAAFRERFIADPAAPWTPREIVDTATPESPVFEPGAQYNYSNTNTILLGMVVERVTGRPLGETYQQRIFNPLGLAHTSYPQDVALPDPHPTGYFVDDATGEAEEAPPVSLTSLGAAGGIVSTIDDVARWGRALGTGALVGAPLRQLSGRLSRPATDGPEYQVYGLGIGRLDGYWGHSGDGVGFQAAVFFNPATKTVIATLVNSSQGEHAAVAVFKALAGVLASTPNRVG